MFGYVTTDTEDEYSIAGERDNMVMVTLDVDDDDTCTGLTRSSISLLLVWRK